MSQQQEWVRAQAESRLAAHKAWTLHVSNGGDPHEVEPSPYFTPAEWEKCLNGGKSQSALTKGMN